MEWKLFEASAVIPHGWYAVAVLPKNHSGSLSPEKTDLEGDNSWRESFGFEKAWHNNGNFFVADPFSYGTCKITDLVTHYANLPTVPTITRSHEPKSRIENNRTNKFITEIKSDSEDFKLGALYALKKLGFD